MSAGFRDHMRQLASSSRDPQTTNRFGKDNCLDILTTAELTEDMRELVTETLAYVQSSQSPYNRRLYDMVLDLKAMIVEVQRRGAARCSGCGKSGDRAAGDGVGGYFCPECVTAAAEAF